MWLNTAGLNRGEFFMKMSNRLRTVAGRKKSRREEESRILQKLEEKMMQRMRTIFLILLPVSSLTIGFAGAIVYESVVGPFWFGFTVVCLLVAWMIFIFALWPGKWLTLQRAKYAFRIRSYLQAMREDTVYFLKLPFRYLTARG